MHPYLENRIDRLQIGEAPAGDFPAHLHTHVELVYLFGGELAMQVAGSSVRLYEGDLCICFPGVAHAYLESNEAQTLMLVVSPDLLPDFSEQLSHFHPREAVLRREALPGDIPLCMEQIALENKGSEDGRVLQGYIQVILARVLPLLSLSGREPGVTNAVYDIMKYLSTHYTEEVSLDTLSGILGVSKSYLSHTFSRHMGVNFRTCVNTLRADRACILLRSTQRRMTDIAYECGFETQRTFNRVFLSLYGISPSDYRRRHRRAGKIE